MTDQAGYAQLFGSPEDVRNSLMKMKFIETETPDQPGVLDNLANATKLDGTFYLREKAKTAFKRWYEYGEDVDIAHVAGDYLGGGLLAINSLYNVLKKASNPKELEEINKKYEEKLQKNIAIELSKEFEKQEKSKMEKNFEEIRNLEGEYDLRKITHDDEIAKLNKKMDDKAYRRERNLLKMIIDGNIKTAEAQKPNYLESRVGSSINKLGGTKMSKEEFDKMFKTIQRRGNEVKNNSIKYGDSTGSTNLLSDYKEYVERKISDFGMKIPEKRSRK